MRTGAPAWGSWTTFYDSVGQAPAMTRADSEDGLVVAFGMDRLVLDLRADEEAPSAGAIGLSGGLSVTIPDQFLLVGFLLVVNGELSMSLGGEASVTGSIGSATRSVEWPIASPAGTPDPRRSSDDAAPASLMIETGFRVECFTRDTPPGAAGAPPFPPLPPLPITVSLQGRRRFVDEFVRVAISGFEVLVLR
jgi:hypothetical protein